MSKRWGAALLAFVVAIQISLGADVTVVTTMSMEGAPAGMMTGANAPRMTLRIKGTKMRNDMEGTGPSVTAIADVAAKQITLLNGQDKTARVLDGKTRTPPEAGGLSVPRLNPTLKPTGQKRTIDGVPCDEYSLTMSMNMAEATAGAQVPAEAAQMMKDVRMLFSGSLWVATTGPGAAEVMAFMKASEEADLAGIMATSMPGMSSGMEQMMAVAGRIQGINYLTEMTMTVEGSGPMVEMMRQSSGIKMTMKVESVSTETIPDSAFAVPADYTTIK